MEPISHTEKVIAGTAQPISHLEWIIATYGGGSGSGVRKAGGTPNGATGAHQNRNTAINATTAGVGGGGGGGIRTRLTSGGYITGYASSGGPGLVAIRFHF